MAIPVSCKNSLLILPGTHLTRDASEAGLGAVIGWVGVEMGTWLVLQLSPSEI